MTFIAQLERRFSKMAKSPRGRIMSVYVDTGMGVANILITYSDYAQCHSRKEKCALIERVIRGWSVH